MAILPPARLRLSGEPEWRLCGTPHNRHTFAVATLREWYRSGADVTGKLPILSAYLGHAEPASTYWYVHAWPELLDLAAERLERLEGERR